ncbi:crotonase/enoyl-CoA hydratase family protein [Micromonospora sp. HUAS LYJ1]|uniref:crotonase/enoyl-CoA hydratase family protein n=1 Tax=Micromonospora sp. HUAS LYJ1 TaxID=3061626 RepID=UPI002671D050|nr:crotonase/enoyl-CoA hydratase family protein [Micromonospora sp. HUAS LYJ1]WKU03526.1 crotonase/enoyl-CoA hydratase family protein [Micromonospora sp. HUAS LYJ1]
MTTTIETTPGGVEPAALYERTGHVAVIRLNRPQVLNAVNAALSAAVGEALEVAAADSGVRAVVVTGSGRAFCAGADLKELAAGRSIAAPEHPEWGFAGLVRHWIDKPLIAAVNGFAMGGGTEIVLACDLVVAAVDARLGLPEVKRGLIAGAGGVVRLQRQVPFKRALQMALTGDPVDAREAADWGLVNVVAGSGAALGEAMALAERIAANAPLSVQHTKRVMHQVAAGGSDWDPDWSRREVWVVNDGATDIVVASRDAAEGATAFAEKRPPVWEGR